MFILKPSLSISVNSYPKGLQYISYICHTFSKPSYASDFWLLNASVLMKKITFEGFPEKKSRFAIKDRVIYPFANEFRAGMEGESRRELIGFASDS